MPRFCVIALVCVQGILAQAPVAPKFEVASVKPSAPDSNHALNCTGGKGFMAKGQTLQNLIVWAYDLPGRGNQVSGGPKWLDAQSSIFDIQGKIASPVSFAECRQMVQAVLADRFQLTFHKEQRELPVFALIVGGKGKNLHKIGADEPAVLSRVTLNGDPIQIGDRYSRTASGRGMTMPELARFLMSLSTVGRMVIDKTGLDGNYGFSLDFSWTLADDTHPDLFTALQDQLGLKLESTKAPVDVLMIDRVEKPSEN